MSYPGCFIVTEESILDNLIGKSGGSYVPYEYTDCVNFSRDNRKSTAN